jgi:hypothetical protein
MRTSRLPATARPKLLAMSIEGMRERLAADRASFVEPCLSVPRRQALVRRQQIKHDGYGAPGGARTGDALSLVGRSHRGHSTIGRGAQFGRSSILTRTNPKTLCGQKKPPAHKADEMPRHYFQPERTTDRPGCLGWDLSIGHSA